MNSTAPSSSVLAQTGLNLGSENSAPATTSPIAAPFSPCFFTAISSSWAARAGSCNVNDANAANRSGFAAQSSASFSFCSLTTLAARSRSAPYQNGLIDSTSISIAIASIALSRSSITMYASFELRTVVNSGGALSPSSKAASRKMQCECTSTVLMRLPRPITGSLRATGAWASAAVRPQPQNTRPAAADSKPRLEVMDVSFCYRSASIRPRTTRIRLSVNRRLQSFRIGAVVFVAAQFTRGDAGHDHAGAGDRFAIDPFIGVPQIRTHQRFRALEIHPLGGNHDHGPRQRATERKPLDQRRVLRNDRGAVDPQRFADARNKEQQSHPRIAD